MSDIDQAEQEVIQTAQWMIKQCEEIFNSVLDVCDNLEIAFEKSLEWLNNQMTSKSKDIKLYEQYEQKYQQSYALAIAKQPRDKDECELLMELYKLNHDKLLKARNELHACDIVHEQLQKTPKTWQAKETTMQFTQTIQNKHRGR